MGYYSDISLYIRVEEEKLLEAIKVLEKYGYQVGCLDVEGNEIRYEETMVKFLGYSCAENMLKELRDYVEEGAVDCYGEDREYSVYEFRQGKLFRVDYEYKPVGEYEIE